MIKKITFLFLVVFFLATPQSYAQVDPNINERLWQGPIIVNFDSIRLFDQIPDAYLQRAANIRMMWGDRSVGGNISAGLDCLVYSSNTASGLPNYCKNTVHPDPMYNSPISLFQWSKTGGYPRSNWQFFFDPGLGVTPALSCSANNGMWDGLIGCFLEHVRNNTASYDVFSYQHSYLTIQEDSNIASLTNGYFINQPNKYDIYDYEQLENELRSQNKVVFYWTTSLARSLGSAVGESYNNQMRQFAQNRNKILFDVADIESKNPVDGSSCFDSRDGVCWCRDPNNSGTCENYSSLGQSCNWDDGVNLPAICQHYTTESVGGHLNTAGMISLAKAYWVLMAQIAGWNPAPVSCDKSQGDVNCSGSTEITDIRLLANRYGSLTISEDTNNDNKTNAFDLIIAIINL